MQQFVLSIVLTITLIKIVVFSYAINTCLETKGFRTFYKVRGCSKSNQRILARKRALNVEDCANYANEKDAFALNYGPIDVAKDYYNCQILPCPELINSLINDTRYDYYSIYANLNGKSIGDMVT